MGRSFQWFGSDIGSYIFLLFWFEIEYGLSFWFESVREDTFLPSLSNEKCREKTKVMQRAFGTVVVAVKEIQEREDERTIHALLALQNRNVCAGTAGLFVQFAPEYNCLNSNER